MPELPEVETIRLGLQTYIVGHNIESVEVRMPKMVEGDIANITGATIKNVRRFGKGLVIDLDNKYSIAIHIKMTGQLIYDGPDRPKDVEMAVAKVGKTLPNLHTHVIFKIKNQNAKGKSTTSTDAKALADRQNLKVQDAFLYYNDIRQFGWIKIVKSSKISELLFFKGLGPEPLNNLTIEQFSTIVKKTKGPIKPLLMDQKKIAGIGNIYANDALFVAKMHPKRPANSLTDEEIEELYSAIEQVLKKGLEVGGASEWQYVNALGSTGKYQNFFQVYGKVDRPCVTCGTTIEKVTMAGRGTFFCPKCQK